MLKCSLFILLILYTYQCAFIGVGTSCFIQLLGEQFFAGIGTHSYPKLI